MPQTRGAERSNEYLKCNGTDWGPSVPRSQSFSLTFVFHCTSIRSSLSLLLGHRLQAVIMSTVFKVYLMRHGETQENKDGITQGQKDTELNAEGRMQAQQAAEHLANVKFTFAYCSMLKRAEDVSCPDFLSPFRRTPPSFMARDLS